MTKRAEDQLRLSEEDGDYGLDPASAVGSGKDHDNHSIEQVMYGLLAR